MKVRLWICRCCGDSHRRYKGEVVSPKSSCALCGAPYYRSHKIPTPHNCKHRRTLHRTAVDKQKRAIRSNKAYLKIQNFKKKYNSKVRNIGGLALKLSLETKRAFRHAMKAKTKPALLNRAKLFLKSLDIDIHNVPENAIARSIDCNGHITKLRGGWNGAPSLKYHETPWYCCRGQYRAGFVYNGHHIELDKSPPIDEIKNTLVHETLHWVDDLSHTHGEHDCYWETRLRKFRSMLGLSPKPQQLPERTISSNLSIAIEPRY